MLTLLLHGKLAIIDQLALAIKINIKGRDETMKTLTDQNITLPKPFGKYIGVDTRGFSVPEEIAMMNQNALKLMKHLF